MLASLANITRIPELRQRIVFTLGMLLVYRLGIFISVPGLNHELLRKQVAGTQDILGMFNLISGGAFENGSIFALGIMPYISSSIIFSLLGVVFKSVEQLQKEGVEGRRKLNQWTRYLTVALCVVQGWGMAVYLESMNARAGVGGQVVLKEGLGFRLLMVVTLMAGSMFLMWIGEQITERGIGNGSSLIIFSGIVARLPAAVISTKNLLGTQIQLIPLLIVGLIIVGSIALIVFFERGQRRIPIQYAKRVVGMRTLGGQTSHLPLKVNTAGVIPPIFASSLLLFPSTLQQFFPDAAFFQRISDWMNPTGLLYNACFVGLIVFFAYFYTAVMFNPVDVAENVRKQGGFIPGIRPGRRTAEYLDRVLSRITFAGALYMALVCVLPSVLIQEFGVPFYFGGTSIMIVVGVAMDTASQIESHLITRNYEGLTGPRGPRIRGRRAE
ncbi:MAG: Protein translocase subunit SecY [Myxococcota bacterium]|nr:Protein translocase subunit SecY [Myxococcota bacterium]